ncbi:MAG: DUF5131 family protein [Candidatus Woesearchaeota archaeon]
MQIKEVRCKSCLNKSKLTDYAINPYVGCQHGCKYCYAVFIRKFQNIKEEWGEFLHAKINCHELLGKELEVSKPGHIWMSSVTDPYQPAEEKYELTRKILETISNSSHRFTVEILTKSGLVERDFELLKDLGVELGMSVNTLDSATARIIEPLASNPEQRINTLRKAKEKGIKIFGFISPVIPGITDLEEVFREMQFCQYVWVELLNTKPSVLSRLMPVIRQHFPNSLKEMQQLLHRKEDYVRKIKEQVRQLEERYNLTVRDIVVH